MHHQEHDLGIIIEEVDDHMDCLLRQVFRRE